MNRRGFLSSIAVIAAGATLDPEKLLWVPGKKLISIPRPPRVLLSAGEAFTITDVYQRNPISNEVAVFVDTATGDRYRFRQRFIATEPITNHDGDGEWRRKSHPYIYAVLVGDWSLMEPYQPRTSVVREALYALPPRIPEFPGHLIPPGVRHLAVDHGVLNVRQA